MNYQKIYDNIIMNAKVRNNLQGYFEKHHIIPKCLGGTNKKENLVKLTPREHFVCHQLLAKIYPNNNKLIYGALAMTIDYYGHRVNNRLYGWIKQKISITHRKENLSTETLQKHSKRMKGNTIWVGRKHSEESKKSMSESKKLLMNDEIKKRLSDSMKGHTIWVGRKHSEESKRKISEYMKMTGGGEKNHFYGKKHKTTICPHCNKEGAHMLMKRWHFENCKHK